MIPPADSGVSRASVSRSRTCLVGVALAVLSFVIYSSAIAALPQLRGARYCCEQSSVAAAVSNVMYGTPPGSLYSGVLGYFMSHFGDESLEQRLEEARMPGVGLPAKPPGELIMTTRDGNGIGYPLVATAAFRLFGMHDWALTLTMLLLLAASTAMFLLRFSRPIYAGVVILYFTALTVMLFTPLVWDPKWHMQIPVGGIRYFSLVSVLPIFHILLELMSPNAASLAARRLPVGLLALQTAILVLVILVRGSTLPLIGAIALITCLFAWRWRRQRPVLLCLFGNVAVIGIVAVCMLGAIAMSVPRQYLSEGQFGTVIWDRIVESLGLNPAFPYPGLQDMFDCKKDIPQGMQPCPSDDNGHCIFVDYVHKHNLPNSIINDQLYGRIFETAMRQAFFKIAARYPVEVFKTFVYYKPLYIRASIDESLRFNFFGDQRMRSNPSGPKVTPYPLVTIWLLLISLGIALVYFSVASIEAGEVLRVAGVILLAALFTLPSYLAVWATLPTCADLLLYCLMAFGLAAGAILLAMRRTLRSFYVPLARTS